MPTGQRIQNNSVMLYLSMGRLRTRRKINSNAVTSDIDMNLLHVSKDIMESPELKAIGEHDTEIKTWVRSRCLPSPFKKKGILILPVELIQCVAERVEQARLDRLPLIEQFLEMYEQRKEEAKPKLGSGFEEKDYPAIEKVREAFTFEFQMWELSAPGQLAAVNRDLYQRELVKMQNMWSEASHQVSAVLLQEFRKLTAHMADKLTPTEDGKAKIFRDTTVTNLTAWLDLFQARNLGDDAALVSAVDNARQAIRGIKPDAIRDSDTLREQLAADFAAITDQVDAALVDRPVRAIDLEE